MKSGLKKITNWRKFSGLLSGALALGAVSQAVAGYKVEEIPLPPQVAPEIGGLAMNSQGELVVVTRRSGILIGQPSADPNAFNWRVFANTSFHNATGVYLLSDSEMLIPQMPELTRVQDTDGDGAADWYECVSKAWGVSGNYHETNAGPIPDGEGNWFVAVGTASHNGPTFDIVRGEFSRIGRRGRNFSAVSYKGWVVKITPDGDLIPWASGFRANNGIAMSPAGDLWVTDNQGDWRGTSPVFHVEKGNFYGHPSSLVWDPEFPGEDPLEYGIDKLDAMRTRAAVLLPQGFMCNSPAEPIFDTSGGEFGPFSGQMFVGDIAGQRVLRLMIEKVGGKYQGACVQFVDGEGLRGGNNRFVFAPDGKSLYVGQTYRGWGRPEEGLQRIVFDGEIPFEIQNIQLQKEGFVLTFTQPLDKTTAAEVSSYDVESYFYGYGHQYGSPQLDQKPLNVKQAVVSDDGTSVFVKLEGLQAKRIVEFDIPGLRSRSGDKIGHSKICYTLNQLAP